MCVIIHRPKDAKEISKEYIEKIIKKNPHGWGFSYVYRKKLFIEKGMEMKEVLEKIRELESKNREFLFHARWATKGEKDVFNCHPYEIGTNCAMFHNGTITDTKNMDFKLWKDKMSDSWHFSKKVDKYLNNKRWTIDEIVKYFKEIINDSRLAFMFSNGNIHKYGKWEELDGCFYSKMNWKYFSEGSWYDGYWAGGRAYTYQTDYEKAVSACEKGYIYEYAIDKLKYNEMRNLVEQYPNVFAAYFCRNILKRY